jgi:hypothetical protein
MPRLIFTDLAGHSHIRDLAPSATALIPDDAYFS